VTIRTEVFDATEYPSVVANHISARLPDNGAVVITGGTTAEKVYPFLALHEHDWSKVEVLFSDERCVPPDDPASNFKMAKDLLFDKRPANVRRMRGEDPPEVAAEMYEAEIRAAVERGPDLVLVGMGADAHVGAMYPDSDAVAEDTRLCVPVDRPDGLKGLTLTAPALVVGKQILLLVTGEAKADTVSRVITGDEGPDTCPARIFAAHPDVTFLLDQAAASKL